MVHSTVFLDSVLTATSLMPKSSPAPVPRAFSLQPLAAGLLFTGVFGIAAMLLSRQPWFASHGFSPLPIAIVLGLLLGNTVYPRMAKPMLAGVNFSKQRLLRLGIVLFGLRLSVQDIAAVGLAAVLIDAVMLAGTFYLAWLAGRRLFGLDRNTAILIGAGSAICGAAAVMATEPLLNAKSEQLAVAVATVVVFGTLAMFLYPALYQWNLKAGWVMLMPQDYGVYVGSTVHEVAQVVVAGAAVSAQAANTAVITKMVRVMMLAPFLLLLSWGLCRTPHAQTRAAKSDAAQSGTAQLDAAPSGTASTRQTISIPWFAIWFLVVVGINSTPWIPRDLVPAILMLDDWLLATAMFALGLSTHVTAIRQAGIRPLALAALLAVWLAAGGLLVNLAAGWLT